MLASTRFAWRARVIVACTMALVVACQGRAENRGPMTSPSSKNPSNRSTDSKSADDAKSSAELADDDSIKDRPGDNGKNAKKKKAKTAKPSAAAAPSGRGRSPRMIIENTPVMSGGGGGLSSET
jgi:hypothetical protein